MSLEWASSKINIRNFENLCFVYNSRPRENAELTKDREEFRRKIYKRVQTRVNAFQRIPQSNTSLDLINKNSCRVPVALLSSDPTREREITFSMQMVDFSRTSLHLAFFSKRNESNFTEIIWHRILIQTLHFAEKKNANWSVWKQQLEKVKICEKAQSSKLLKVKFFLPDWQ